MQFSRRRFVTATIPVALALGGCIDIDARDPAAFVANCVGDASADIDSVNSDDERIEDVRTIQHALDNARELVEEQPCEDIRELSGLQSDETWSEVEAALDSLDTNNIEHDGYVFLVGFVREDN